MRALTTIRFALGLKVRGAARDPRWRALEKEILRERGFCIVCGTTKDLVGHHIVPVHVDRSKELDKDNVAVLCESAAHNDHLIWGHLLSWESWNKDVCADAAAYRDKLLARPLSH